MITSLQKLKVQLFRPKGRQFGETIGQFLIRGIGSRLSTIGEILNIPFLIYNPLHFRHFETLAQKAAPIVATTIRKEFPAIQSIADVGCGTGNFSAALTELGITVEACEYSQFGRQRAIKKGIRCHPFDLVKTPPSPLAGAFDAVICFEVAEHVLPTLSQPLVNYCASLANFVIFTAATPGQGGTGHINEAPNEFWIEAFSRVSMTYCAESTTHFRHQLREALAEHSPWLWRNVLIFQKAPQ